MNRAGATTLILLAASVSLAPSVAASAGPPTSATPPRSADPLAPSRAGEPAFPTAYSVLLTRSLFSRAGDATPSPIHPGGSGGPQPGGPGDASGLALRGVAREQGAFVAFVEDTAAHHTARVATGEALARGHVLRIDLDCIEYDVGGHVTRVRVGENLMGVPMPPMTQPVPGPPGAGAPPGPPGQGPPGQGPPGPPGGPESGPEGGPMPTEVQVESAERLRAQHRAGHRRG